MPPASTPAHGSARFDAESVYALLPAIYRVRDEQGPGGLPGPLRALVDVIAEQIAVLEEDLDQLYDDLFIETCAEWVVPYIGDLIGARGLYGLTPTTFSQRAQVANTIGYRRRKGTAAVLEQLARDVTGWPASTVEFFQRLATTQHLHHLRREDRTMDVRDWEALERLDTPFDRSSHTIDTRSIARDRGRYNIPNVGIFLWRLAAYPSSAAPASRVDDRRYRFSPLGNDIPLFNLPVTEDEITHLAEPVNVPMPISRRVLDRYLDRYYGPGKSVLLRIDGEPVPAERIVVCNLENDDLLGGATWAHAPADDYAIDPVLGRIALPENQPVPDAVTVDYHYGFSADMGGGEYNRIETFTGLAPVVNVPGDHAAILDALLSLGSESGAVEIGNSERYVGPFPDLALSATQNVELRAGEKDRPLLQLDGDWVIDGADDAELTLNGLLITDGALRVTGALQRLVLRHCTLVPGRNLDADSTPQQPDAPSLIVESTGTQVEIEHSILGGIRADASVALTITNSIVDSCAPTGVAIAALDNVALDGSAPGGTLLHVQNCTIIGKVAASRMEYVANTIFLAEQEAGDGWPAPVFAAVKQQGCVRFSYLPPDAQTPRRYHCLPTAENPLPPRFASLRYGLPGYCQLAPECPQAIREGADDESEIGVFHDLFQPQRVTNLRVRLDEYLRFGLEAGIIFAT